MGKSNLSKKQKLAISASAAIAAASSIVAPLAMTGCANTDIVKQSAIDKEYGVTKETYEDLKTQFMVEYGNRLKKVYLETSKDYKMRMDALEKDLSYFDEAQKQTNYGYTITTSALIDFAREQKQKYPTGNAIETEPYDIQLVRHTRIKWSDLNDLYAGMADSFKTYMHNNKMPASTINRIMVESKAKFDDLTKQLKTTYGNDALAGLLKAKEKLITFFDDVNDDIAFLAATLRVKDFLSEFDFEYKEYNEDGSYYLDNCLDKLQNDYPNDFVVGKVLSNKLMNKIFTVTRRTTNKAVSFDAKTIVPGYTVYPKLVACHSDDYSNIHTIAIDFGLVKNVYAQKYAKDPEKLAMVTGHVYNFNPNLLEKNNIDKNSSLADAFKIINVTSNEYIVHLSPIEEATRLKKVYFDKKSLEGSISFKWDMNHQAYEAFFDNARQNKDGTWSGTLTTQSLANAGLMISNDGKNYLSINFDEAKNNNDLANKFTNFCSLSSDVKIVEKNDKIVDHVFKAMYKNSIYTKDNQSTFELKKECYENQCVNFKISDNFFSKVNDKFNNVAKNVGCYIDFKNSQEGDMSYVEQACDEAWIFFVIKLMGLVMNGSSTGALISQIVKPWKAETTTNIYLVLALITVIANASIEVINFSLFLSKYFIPIRKYKNDIDNCKTLIYNSDLLSMLQEDLSNSFVLCNDDGTYDKVKYAQQKAKFEKKSMPEMLNMYRKYSTIWSYSNDSKYNTPAQNAMKQFDNLLSQKGISEEEFNKTFGDWEIGKGKFWWITFALDFVTIFFNFILAFLLNYYFGDIANDVLDAYAKEAVRKQTENKAYMNDENRKMELLENRLFYNIQKASYSSDSFLSVRNIYAFLLGGVLSADNTKLVTTKWHYVYYLKVQLIDIYNETVREEGRDPKTGEAYDFYCDKFSKDFPFLNSDDDQFLFEVLQLLLFQVVKH